MLEGLRAEVGSGAHQWLLLLIPAVIIMAFLPTIIALVRRRKDCRRIFAFNLVATLSFPAWFATLVWALTGVKKEETGKQFSKARWLWPSLILMLLVGGFVYKFAIGLQ